MRRIRYQVLSFLTLLSIWCTPLAQAGYLYGGTTAADLACTGCVSLTTEVSGILLGANGGTSNGFFAVSGPTTSLKTFAFPNASDTVATYGVANAFSALQTFSAGVLLGSDDTLAWGDAVGGGTADTWLTRISAGVLQHGLPDSSSPTAHVLTSQGYNNAVATAGPLFTIKGSNGGLTSGTGGELRLQGGLSGAAAGTGGAITFYTAPLAAGTTPAARMTILPTGNVGIGTTAPGQTLEVNGNILLTNLASSSALNHFNYVYADGGAKYGMTLGYIAASGTGYRTQIIAPDTQAIGFGFHTNGVAPTLQSSFTERMTILGTGNVGIGTTNPASLLDLRSGDLTMSGANGQKYVIERKTELITVASGVLTQASTITIPANAILEAAEMRVTVQPGGTATMVATATTSATVLQQGASMSTAATTTDVGTRANGTNYTGIAAQTVTFTFNGVTSDALGRIRLDIYYKVATAATS